MSARFLKRIVCFHSDVDFGVTTHLDEAALPLVLPLDQGLEVLAHNYQTCTDALLIFLQGGPNGYWRCLEMRFQERIGPNNSQKAMNSRGKMHTVNKDASHTVGIQKTVKKRCRKIYKSTV